MNAKAVASVLLCCLIPAAVVQASGHWTTEAVTRGRAAVADLERDPGEPPPPGSPVPTGGNCSDYIDLSGQELPIQVTGNTVGASNDYGPFPMWPSCWETGAWDTFSCAGQDVTYKWTVPATGRYTISLCGSSYDTCLLIYDFTCPEEPVYPDDFICGNDQACGIGGQPWNPTNPQSELLAMQFAAGQEILIVVDGYGNRYGWFMLSISEYEPAQDLNTFITETMDTEHVPGLAACGIRDGEIVWTGAYGYADIEHNVAVTDTTLFTLMSISKTVVGVALMQLWEERLFELDDDVNTHLDFAVNHPNPSCAGSAITFRMLMTHTSSIRDNWPVLMSVVSWGGDSPIPLSSFLRDYLTPGGAYYSPTANFNYQHCPGEIWDYSNAAATLSGYLVERISHTSLESYCQDSLFAPLGMEDTSWFLANVDTTNLAISYYWGPGSSYIRLPHCGSGYYPAGWLKSSTSQLAHYLTAFMQCGEFGGERILACPTVELMTTDQFTELMFGQGLVWYREPLGGRWIWGHNGKGWGIRTEMFYCPDDTTGVIVLTNGNSRYATTRIMHEIFERIRPSTSVPGITRVSAAQRLTLDQNRPNPFNPSTVLDYSLSQPDRVTLAIYNILGRRVATLYDGLQGAGQHRVRWDATGFGSGPYFARIASQGEVKTIKLVLTR